MSKQKIKLYHGTDYDAAKKIQKEGFKVKENTRHWLGNGIYFFTDLSLAKWWTENPTKKFGARVEKPIVIECEVEFDEDRVLNLCKLEGYKKYVKYLDLFFELHDEFEIVPAKPISYEKLRCLFFDYIFALKDIDMIIAPFYAENQPYFPKSKNKNLFDEMHIMYIEQQVCLREECQNLIAAKTVLEVYKNDKNGEK